MSDKLTVLLAVLATIFIILLWVGIYTVLLPWVIITVVGIWGVTLTYAQGVGLSLLFYALLSLASA